MRGKTGADREISVNTYTGGFTTMLNHHLRNRNLSLKAVGLLSKMLSLPPDWDYSIRGLAMLNTDGIDGIRTAMKELEDEGYVVRVQSRDERGRMSRNKYTVYALPQKEKPSPDLPSSENPTTVKPPPDEPMTEKPTQINTNQVIPKKRNDSLSKYQSIKYIRITDIDDDSHTYIDSAPVSPAGVLEGKYRVRENDILFARTGASVGKSYLYQASDGDMYFAGFLIRIHVIDGVDSGYVFLNTLTEEYNRWVALESTRSGQPGINAEQYRRYRFKLPPLETQKQISAIAQKIDAQIKRESQCLRLLQKQKDGFLQQLFI